MYIQKNNKHIESIIHNDNLFFNVRLKGLFNTKSLDDFSRNLKYDPEYNIVIRSEKYSIYVRNEYGFTKDKMGIFIKWIKWGDM